MRNFTSARLMLTAALLLGSASALFGQTGATCTPKDMQGAWVTQPQGFFTAGPVAGPFGATGTLVFDGVSRFGGIASSSFNGQIIFPFGADGTYTLTADCRLTVFEETLRITFDGWLVTNKTEVVFFQPDPTSISVNQLRRQNIASCDLTNLKDNWAISASGFNIITGGRFALNARFAFDGFGRITGIASKSDNGVITQNGKYNGIYTVNPKDCSFNMKITDDIGVTSGYYGSLYDNSRQFIVISNDPGFVVTGYGKRP